MNLFRRLCLSAMALNLVFFQSVTHAQSVMAPPTDTTCLQLDAKTKEEFSKKIDEISALLEKASGQLTIEMSNGKYLTHQTSKTTAYIAGILAAAAGITVAAMNKGYLSGSLNTFFGRALFGVGAALTSIVSGLLSWATNDSSKNVRIDTLKNEIDTQKYQLEGLKTALRQSCK